MDSRSTCLTRSRQWLERARRVVPCQTQTLSKGPSQFVQGVSPIYLERGDGCRVWDVDGNEYIDYMAALGPVVLGYRHPKVDRAISAQLEKGISFSLPHPLEVELAEELVRVIPCAEMVRYGKNGSDVTAAAVRIARAYTGRDRVAVCGYHGAQDWYLVTTSRRRGVPGILGELARTFEYNRIETLERLFEENPGQVAAVIMEPISLTPPQEGFLHAVRELVSRQGALLIFDEIVTGFRLALGGAQEFFGVAPDLATFGKALANGMPLAALVGRETILRECEDVFFSMTFAGETLSLAAGLATLRAMQRERVIERLRERGPRLLQGLEKLIEKEALGGRVRVNGYPAHQSLEFQDSEGKADLVLKSLFQQEAVCRGILTAGGHNLMLAHDEAVIERTLDRYTEVFEVLGRAVRSGNPGAWLRGPAVQPVFRPTL